MSDGCTIEGSVYERKGGSVDECLHGKVIVVVGWKDRWVDGRIGRLVEGWVEKWMDGWKGV